MTVICLQALNACVQGDMAAADAQLSLLGCKWRLSQAVWEAAAAAAAATGAAAAEHIDHIAPAAQQQQQQQCDSGGSSVLVHDAPLPPALLHALQRAFHSSSDFWSRHNYGDDDTPFFSYVIDLQAAAAVGPSNALEAAALLLQQQFKQLAHAPLRDSQQQLTSASAAATAAAAATHVEWWAHTRPACAPHQLHFDAAEGAFRRGLAAFRLAHPVASSVLYLIGAGGPTLVLGQTTAGAVAAPEQHEGQQQQGTQQQPLEEGSTAAAPAAGADDGAPAAKRAKLLDAAPEDFAAAEDGQQGHHKRHHHHHHHRHHQHSDLSRAHDHQQQRPPLASHAWLVAPAAGRFALWPGCLLHGVLPGAVMPLGEHEEADDEDSGKPSPQQQQEQQQQGWYAQGEARSDGRGEEHITAAAGVSDAAGDASRTTLILAWWSCDPRTLVAQQQQHQQKQPGEAEKTTPTAPAAEAPGLPAGDGSASTISRLGPCMAMPALDSSDNSHDAAPGWLQALADGQAADMAATHTAAAAAASRDTAGGSAGWQLLSAASPAWEQVQPHPAHPAATAAAAAAAGTVEEQGAAAEAAAGHQFGLPAELLRHSSLSRAELPCLRFFLRSSRDIRAAYIPDFEAWQQPAAAGAPAEMLAAVDH
jgi:hypothetical protein